MKIKKFLSALIIICIISLPSCARQTGDNQTENSLISDSQFSSDTKDLSEEESEIISYPDSTPEIETESATDSDGEILDESESVEERAKDPNEDIFLFNETSDGIIITGLKDKTADQLSLPAEISGNPVIGVADSAFAGENFTRLTLPEGLQTIGDNAFKNCKKLKSAYLPASLLRVGYAIFGGCSALEELNVPFLGNEDRQAFGFGIYPFGYYFGTEKYSGSTPVTQYFHTDESDEVTSADYRMPNAFKRITVRGKGNSYLPYASFYNCSFLEGITIEGGVTNIGPFAFSGCVAPINWVDPAIEVIGVNSLADFKGKSLELPASAKGIEKLGLSGCFDLENLVVPDAVEYMDIYAFSGCQHLTKITLGKNVKKIGMNCFYFCVRLKNVILSEDIEEISDYAFSNCRALESIDLPANVKVIGAYAFYKCAALQKATFKDPEGWRYYSPVTSGNDASAEFLSDAKQNAYRFRDRYAEYTWEKRS
ncbi:MAG: leucine-rich repeat domain-containing protein [Clostridia bacterium]|nr:leucine-rich repeat domain-containing protein [Clostridia bacterium]